jgi:hypothetical protein
MFDNKKIVLEDKGEKKSFTINALPAIPAMKLMREIALLLADTELIKAVVLQQVIQNFLQSGTKIEGVEESHLQSLMQMDTSSIISHLIQSIIKGLDDDKMESLINKCMASVVYHNGSENRPGDEALQYGMIKDFAVVIALMYEVFVINFSGAIDRVKKLLGQAAPEQKPQG